MIVKSLWLAGAGGKDIWVSEKGFFETQPSLNNMDAAQMALPIKNGKA
ncbi:hypothetical protein GGR43_004009 [Sphingobium jiangsuense]|uniref:Uncharacterized protein n=1 Tax=Sphingobium jiangsuense TaxID=870476 RepID=A0A7W6BJP2_9SPHN|nr:hypothetical protein [Sphingobium jiangsuense]